jgi:hypothetical protein
MSDPLELQTASLSLDLERQVDDLCDEFEDELRQGDAPVPEVYLARIAQSARGQLQRELARLLRAYAKGSLVPGQPNRGPTSRHSGADAKIASEAGSASNALGSTTRMRWRRSRAVFEHVDKVDRFRYALDRGEKLDIEEIVSTVDRGSRERLLRELLKVDMEFTPPPWRNTVQGSPTTGGS